MRTYRYKTKILDLIHDIVAYVFVGRYRRRPIDPSMVCAVDGDTIHIAGVPYRLAGFDTPEVFEARCPHEYELGRRATHMLKELVHEAQTLELVVRERDRYGRVIATLFVDDVDVAQTMIESGLARSYAGHQKRHAWCACRID